MTREEQINLYLKERNIPITSLEANSIMEGIKWADEHPNLYNMKLWIARNQDNSLHIHNVKPSPIYDDYTKQWTYEECCNILGIEDRENGYCGYEYELLGEFQKLYICRDAYWKIAGEQMGLGKPWKPDWNNVSDKHCIYFVSGEIWLTECQTRQCTLAFPTAEMRDAFYENFKELIDKCKELL